MAKQTRMLRAHGGGGREGDTGWQKGWPGAIRAGFAQTGPDIEAKTAFLPDDGIFAKCPIPSAGMAEALIGLGISGVGHGLGDLFRARGLSDALRWTAGMAVQRTGNGRRHTVVSHGALNHCLSRILCSHVEAGKSPTVADSVGQCVAGFKELDRNQHPAILGPMAALSTLVLCGVPIVSTGSTPWFGAGETQPAAKEGSSI